MAGGMEREGKEVFVIVKLLGLPFFKVSSLNLVILSLCNRFHTEIQPAASRIDLAARTCWANGYRWLPSHYPPPGFFPILPPIQAKTPCLSQISHPHNQNTLQRTSSIDGSTLPKPFPPLPLPQHQQASSPKQWLPPTSHGGSSSPSFSALCSCW